MKITLTTKNKGDHLKDWLTGLGFSFAIVNNYDEISVELTEEEVVKLKADKSGKRDPGEILRNIT